MNTNPNTMKTGKANGYNGIWFTLGQYLGDECGDSFEIGAFDDHH